MLQYVAIKLPKDWDLRLLPMRSHGSCESNAIQHRSHISISECVLLFHGQVAPSVHATNHACSAVKGFEASGSVLEPVSMYCRHAKLGTRVGGKHWPPGSLLRGVPHHRNHHPDTATVGIHWPYTSLRFQVPSRNPLTFGSGYTSCWHVGSFDR